MSWICPHRQNDDYCCLRKKKCEPLSKGCVVANRFKPAEKNHTGKSSKK